MGIVVSVNLEKAYGNAPPPCIKPQNEMSTEEPRELELMKRKIVQVASWLLCLVIVPYVGSE